MIPSPVCRITFRMGFSEIFRSRVLSFNLIYYIIPTSLITPGMPNVQIEPSCKRLHPYPGTDFFGSVTSKVVKISWPIPNVRCWG